MSSWCWGRRRVSIAILFFSLTLPAYLQAQPWVPPQGEGSVSLVYQNVYIRDHLFSGGLRRDVGHIRTHSLSIEVDYGVTDRVSLSASLPFIRARYRGSSPHTHADGRTVDDGSYHGGFQDLRVDGRFRVMEFPIAVTPFAAFNVPTRDYEFFAHSAIGVGLREAQVGAYVGAARARFYVQGRYSYAVPERVVGRRRTRSNIDAEVGWLARPRVRVFAFQLRQISHDGLEISPGFPGLTDEEKHHHDQLGRASTVEVGGGVAVALTPSMDLVCGALTTLTGANTHTAQYALTVGASWSFGRSSGTSHHSATARSSRSARVPMSSAR